MRIPTKTRVMARKKIFTRRSLSLACLEGLEPPPHGFGDRRSTVKLQAYVLSSDMNMTFFVSFRKNICVTNDPFFE